MIIEDGQVPQLNIADVGLWRYIDFDKYMSMLEYGSLYFANSRCFPDGFEGLGTKRNREDLRTPAGRPASHVDVWKEKFFINCGHINTSESQAMWDIYNRGNTGIAIQSSYQRLRKCLSDDGDNDFFLGPVVYLDFNDDKLDIDSPIVRHFLKRQYFIHEQELRAVYVNLGFKKGRNILKPKLGENGVHVKVDLSLRITQITLAPRAEKWLFELVRDVTKRYGFAFPVRLSQIIYTPSADY